MTPVSSVIADGQAPSIESRVARLEVSVETLHSEVANVGSKIDRLASVVAASRGVNWGAVAVFVGAVGMASGLVAYVVNDAKQEMASHIALDGHPEALLKHARTDERISTVNARLESIEEQDDRMYEMLEKRGEWMMDNSNIDATQSEKIAEMEREHSRYRNELEAIRGSRWTSKEGLEDRDRIASLESKLASMEILISETRAEQVRRTQRVYDENQ